MPRRRKDFLSDGDSDSDRGLSGSEAGFDSQEDQDVRDERRLFENKGNKRRRTAGNAKASAWEGIFGDDEEEAGNGRRTGIGGKRRGKAGRPSLSDWTKAPAFVSLGAHDLQKEEQQQLDEKLSKPLDNEEEISESESSSDSDEEESRPPSPRARDDEAYEDEDRPQGMGLGFRQALPASSNGGDQGGIGSSSQIRPGIGTFSEQASRLNKKHADVANDRFGAGAGLANAITSDSKAVGVPTAFGRPPPSLTSSSGPRTQRSFLAKPADTALAPTVELTAHEKAHFAKIQSSFGARLLANMGWQAGKGLGAQEDGRAVPIEAGKVLRGQGIQKGVRTEESKREARRNGITFSDDEEEEEPRPRGHRAKGPKVPKGKTHDDQGWKKHRKVKVKVQHKTYEQLLEEAGQTAPVSVGLILDARGGELKEVSSLSSLSLSAWAPTETMRLPELRHNLQLVVETSNQDVADLVKEGKIVNERRRWASREEQRSRAKAEEADRRIYRLKEVQKTIQDIDILVAKLSLDPDKSLKPLENSFTTLLDEYPDEYKSMNLDDVVVGTISQVLGEEFASWQPFDVSSTVLFSSLHTWRGAYNMPREDETHDLALSMKHDEPKSTAARAVDNGNRTMTAWESLIWAKWLPKVRSAINNDWDPADGAIAAQLLETWSPILPLFIRDNVLDQLILPKVKDVVEHWDPKRSQTPLSTTVFPWLPLLGQRVEEVMELAKRRIRSALRKWVVKDGVPRDLIRWKKSVFSSSEWDKLIIQFVLPKLGVCLRDDFTINPRKQNMVPLTDWVLPWHELIRPSMFSQLLEAEFFPKWLDMLHIWLIQPSYVPKEVADWYQWWKDSFPQTVVKISGVAHGFNAGVDLMRQAMELGPDAPSKLRKPKFEPFPPSSKASKPSRSAGPARASSKLQNVPSVTDLPDITFRAVAEQFAAQHDLIFLPTGRSHDKTGKPLFRVSKNVDGRGGVTVYVGDEAVYAHVDGGDYVALSLEDMVKRAGA